MVFCGALHQALQEKFGGEWAPLRALWECYGDESSGRIFVVLTQYCEALMHHNKQRNFIKTLKHHLALEGGSMFGIGQDDILSTTGAACTVVSAKGFLAAMFFQFVGRDRKRKTEPIPKLEIFSHINKYVGFACQAATSADLARVHVSLTQDVAVTLRLGENGEVFGLESLLPYVPHLRAYWEAAHETPFIIDDDTCIYVHSDFYCARCADFILVLSTFSRSSTSPQQSILWTHICIPILRALFTQLSDLFRMQTWRFNAVAPMLQTETICMPGKLHHTLTDSDTLIYIRRFRNKEPVWYKDLESTKHLKARLKQAVGLAYLNHIPDQFKGSSHFCVSFDPGLHSRQESLGLIVSSPDAPVPYLMAYGPVIVIRRVAVSELRSELVLDLIGGGKVSVCFYISFERSRSTVPLST